MPVKKKLLHRLLGICVQHAQTLSVVLYLASIITFLGLPLAAKRNYLDENALLAGFSHSKIRYSSAFSSGKDSYRSKSDGERDPLKLAEAMLDLMQVDHWRISQQSQCNASTMHGILRAPRGDGKEAIVLATPLPGTRSAGGEQFAAIQVAVYVLHFLQQVSWLAKDIVWLVVDADACALQSTKDWLDSYHGQPSNDHTAFGRSGLLQQAVVLEMDADRFNALQVRTLGWNGQLPMLDLYYLIKRLSENGPGLQLSQKMSTPFMHHMPAKLQKYWPDMWKVMTFSWQQATTMPTGLHAEFIQHGIDAVTIETYMQPSQGAWSYGVEEGVTNLAVLLELTVRSLNNLLERFHHSTTFYLLLSPDWHVPFQVHVVPPLLLAIVLVLQAADTAQLNSVQGQGPGDSPAWSAALKHCFCLQVLCHACNFCFISFGKATGVLPLCLQGKSASWQPQPLHVLAVYTIAAASALWLVSRVCSGNNCNYTVQHRLYTRTVAQGLAAAQASALICTNWATAFYTLVLLVPLLSQNPSSSKWRQWAHTCLTLMLVMVIFLACFVVVSSDTYSPLMKSTSSQTGWTGSTDFVDNAVLASLLSWHSTSLSAPLTILLPACMVMLQ